MEDFLLKWQTLIGAIIALIAGAAAVIVVLHQTGQHRREAKDRRLRLARAFRAGLAEDLAAIVNYTKESAAVSAFVLRYLKEEEEGGTHHGTRDQLACPNLSARVTDDLRQLIENLETADATAIADMLGCYQVQRSRLCGLVQDWNQPSRQGITNLVTRNGAELPLTFTVELYLRSSRMLPFARREESSIMPAIITKQSVSDALKVLEVHHILGSEGAKRILRKLGGGS